MVAQRFGDPDESGMEDIGVGFGPGAEEPLHELKEEAAVRLHRARDVEEDDDADRPVPAPAANEVDGLAAPAEVAPHGPAEIEARRPVRVPVAPRDPMAHGAGEPGREPLGFAKLRGVGEVAEVGPREVRPPGGHEAARSPGLVVVGVVRAGRAGLLRPAGRGRRKVVPPRTGWGR